VKDPAGISADALLRALPFPNTHVRFHALSPFVLEGDAHDGHATCGSVTRASRFLIGLVTCFPTH